MVDLADIGMSALPHSWGSGHELSVGFQRRGDPISIDERWRLNMTNGQDINSKTQAEPGESLKDGAPNKISSTPGKDALSDGALDDVSGGAWPYYTNTASSGGTPGG
jgi:hypothetical protein